MYLIGIVPTTIREVTVSEDTTADSRLISRLNELVRKYYGLIEQRKLLKETFEAEQADLKAGYTSDTTRVEHELDQVKRAIVDIIRANKLALMPNFPSPKSFTTLPAVFKLTATKGKTTVSDAKAILAIARKMRPGIMRTISRIKVKVTVELVEDKFLAWLKGHPEFYERFADHLVVTEDHDSASIKPNMGSAEWHGVKSISPKAVTIGPI